MYQTRPKKVLRVNVIAVVITALVSLMGGVYLGNGMGKTTHHAYTQETLEACQLLSGEVTIRVNTQDATESRLTCVFGDTP